MCTKDESESCGEKQLNPSHTHTEQGGRVRKGTKSPLTPFGLVLVPYPCPSPAAAAAAFKTNQREIANDKLISLQA